MKKSNILLFLLMLIFVSCKNKNTNPYQNNLGIQPAQLAQADIEHYTTILWKDSIQNFGEIKVGDTVQLHFTFKNTGTYPLFLTGAKPNCGCTVTDYPRTVIQPGEEGVLTAKFGTTNEKGIIKKTIRVSSNTTNNIYHVLQFYGETKK